MIYTDSGYWIALYSEVDEKHMRASELWKSLSNESMSLSEHCLGEVFTFLSARHNAELAKKACLNLLSDPRMTIVQAGQSDWTTVIELAAKFQVSFADAITFISMRRDGISKIVSFDGDFDSFPKVTRIK